jgi:hypothetical protein
VRTIYICELCGEEFVDFNECWDHENKDHVKPEAYRVKPLEYLHRDVSHCGIRETDPRPYPTSITCPMEDGATIRYSFDRILTLPELPATPEVDSEEKTKPEVTE